MLEWGLWNMSFDVRTRLSRLRGSAKARGIRLKFDINKYQALINIGCHYCGIDLKDEAGYCLDRIDSNTGYIFTNVVPCCKICNIAKSSMKFEDFVSWVKRAYMHIKKVEEFIKTDSNKVGAYTLQKEINVFKQVTGGKRAEYIEWKPKKNYED